MHCKLDELSSPLYRTINIFSWKLKLFLNSLKCYIYLVGSSKNKIDGLLNNSTPMESRLHSPPDKQEIRVCLLFVSPSVFIISLVCHTGNVRCAQIHIYLNNRNTILLIFFLCPRLYCQVSDERQTSCIRRRISLVIDDLFVWCKPIFCGMFLGPVFRHQSQLVHLLQSSCQTIFMPQITTNCL
jgi:hypothetical protein